MASLFSDSIINSQQDNKNIITSTITLEIIVGRMFYFHTQAHLFHFQTTSYAEHKALDKLYNKLVDLKDDIGEQAMGYFKSRPKNIATQTFVNYSPNALQVFLDEIQSFANQLQKFADDNEYSNLSNLAQELSGLAASTRYLLTLS